MSRVSDKLRADVRARMEKAGMTFKEPPGEETDMFFVLAFGFLQGENDKMREALLEVRTYLRASPTLTGMIDGALQ